MIEHIFTLGDNQVHINCIGKEDIESHNLEDKTIPEIVKFFTQKDLKVFYLEQEHGVQFYKIHSSTTLPLKGDAFYTTEKNLALVIKTADCIPLFFWSNYPVIGAIHSGWRGTSQNIVQKVCIEVIQSFQLQDLYFYIGPCIRQNQYEVDYDVARLFEKDFPLSLKKYGNKYLFSNDSVTKQQILTLPIKTSLEDSGICNYLDSRFYSHRRKDKGRNLNVIYMI
ncbi:MAG: polyphenol oxidase family protein [Leptospiraceae bacterium]|nr:polyphenol oxidase family protein [Leptospiraceae bacterium]